MKPKGLKDEEEKNKLHSQWSVLKYELAAICYVCHLKKQHPVIIQTTKNKQRICSLWQDIHDTPDIKKEKEDEKNNTDVCSNNIMINIPKYKITGMPVTVVRYRGGWSDVYRETVKDQLIPLVTSLNDHKSSHNHQFIFSVNNFLLTPDLKVQTMFLQATQHLPMTLLYQEQEEEFIDNRLMRISMALSKQKQQYQKLLF